MKNLSLLVFTMLTFTSANDNINNVDLFKSIKIDEVKVEEKNLYEKEGSKASNDLDTKYNAKIDGTDFYFSKIASPTSQVYRYFSGFGLFKINTNYSTKFAIAFSSFYNQSNLTHNTGFYVENINFTEQKVELDVNQIMFGETHLGHRMYKLCLYNSISYQPFNSKSLLSAYLNAGYAEEVTTEISLMPIIIGFEYVNNIFLAALDLDFALQVSKRFEGSETELKKVTVKSNFGKDKNGKIITKATSYQQSKTLTFYNTLSLSVILHQFLQNKLIFKNVQLGLRPYYAWNASKKHSDYFFGADIVSKITFTQLPQAEVSIDLLFGNKIKLDLNLQITTNAKNKKDYIKNYSQQIKGQYKKGTIYKYNLSKEVEVDKFTNNGFTPVIADVNETSKVITSDDFNYVVETQGNANFKDLEEANRFFRTTSLSQNKDSKGSKIMTFNKKGAFSQVELNKKSVNDFFTNFISKDFDLDFLPDYLKKLVKEITDDIANNLKNSMKNSLGQGN